MIKPIGIYHIGIPVDDIQRAEVFYTKTLGMTVADRLGEAGARLTRLKCGDADVVLFQRPRPLERNTLKEDGISHQAFEVPPEKFDDAVAFLKDQGCYHAGPVVRASGRAAPRLAIVSCVRGSCKNSGDRIRRSRENGNPELFEFPGFRGALALASVPGMTPNYVKSV